MSTPPPLQYASISSNNMCLWRVIQSSSFLLSPRLHKAPVACPSEDQPTLLSAGVTTVYQPSLVHLCLKIFFWKNVAGGSLKHKEAERMWTKTKALDEQLLSTEIIVLLCRHSVSCNFILVFPSLVAPV